MQQPSTNTFTKPVSQLSTYVIESTITKFISSFSHSEKGKILRPDTGIGLSAQVAKPAYSDQSQVLFMREANGSIQFMVGIFLLTLLCII